MREHKRLIETVRDYQRLLETMRDYERALETNRDYQRLLETIKEDYVFIYFILFLIFGVDNTKTVPEFQLTCKPTTSCSRVSL